MTLVKFIKECRQLFSLSYLREELLSWSFAQSVLFELLSSFLFFYIVFAVHINVSINTSEVVETMKQLVRIPISSYYCYKSGSEPSSHRQLCVVLFSTGRGSSPSGSGAYYLALESFFAESTALFINAVSTGLARTLVIYSLRSLCATQLNPLVTFSQMLTQQFPVFKGLLCILAQMVASVVAAVLAPLLFASFSLEPSGRFPHDTASATLLHIYPSAHEVNGFLMELILSTLFIYFNLMIAFDPDVVLNVPELVLARKRAQPPRASACAIEHLDEAMLEEWADGLGGGMEGFAMQSMIMSSSEAAKLASEFQIMRRQSTMPATASVERQAPFCSDYYELQTSHDRYAHARLFFFKCVCFGLLITLFQWMGSSMSGGAINPARVFGPALINGYWKAQWIYWAGGFVGALIGSLLYEWVYVQPRLRMAHQATVDYKTRLRKGQVE